MIAKELRRLGMAVLPHVLPSPAALLRPRFYLVILYSVETKTFLQLTPFVPGVKFRDVLDSELCQESVLLDEIEG